MRTAVLLFGTLVYSALGDHRQINGTRTAGLAPPKVILTLFVDDLGWFDTQTNNPNAPTPTIGALANHGLRLNRHYAYTVCSPSRRSFMSGRLPVHVGSHQAGTCSNYLPLNFTLISGKLKQAGFENHFVGKGHLGYQTEDHMPINRGFDSHVGYLHADEDYQHGDMTFKKQSGVYWQKDFWHDHKPGDDLVDDIEYSTNWYSNRAVNIINSYTGNNPMWLHIAYQGVHAPWTQPPAWEHIKLDTNFCHPTDDVSRDQCQTYANMIHVVDNGIYNVTQALKAKGLWDQTLVMFTSDNGGVGPGNNHPLKGKKKENYEGGMRVTAFLGGGWLPSSMRGQSSDAVMHIADWYATFSTLVGVDPTDTDRTIYDVDSVNMWPVLSGETRKNPRTYLPLSDGAIIKDGQYKLITDAPQTFSYTPNNTHVYHSGRCTLHRPCIFDLLADPGESNNIYDSNKKLAKELMDQLSTYSQYTVKSMTDAELANYNCHDEPTDPQNARKIGWPWAPPNYRYVFAGTCCFRRQGGTTKADLII